MALELDETPPREPGPGEVRVSVEAVGLNFPDLLLCAGRYPERPERPFSPGYEAAGTVVEAGAGSAHRVGQPVIVVPELPDGAMQGSLTVPDTQVYPVPSMLSMSTAAVLHIAYTTAHLALHRR
ncbi:MAG: alcohol dehydrogenase catalytic domain-containing protein, partial [Sciscionella sp.]